MATYGPIIASIVLFGCIGRALWMLVGIGLTIADDRKHNLKK